MTSTEIDPSSAVKTSDNPHHDRRWLILAVLGIAQLMVVLDGTVVNIALPTAQHALGFSDANRQWIVTAYSLAFGSLLLLGGRLADLLGRKRMFLIGLAGFAIASAVGGAATGFGMLVTARAVQGAFGAMLAPAALSLLTTTFTHPKERAKAFGVYGAIAGGGAALGLLLGGVLTEYLSWRWCMYVNLIFAAVAFIGGLAWLQNQRASLRPQLDIPGIITVSAGLFALVYGFSHAATGGWGTTTTVGFLIIGVVLLAVFVGIQTRSAHPLLPLRILTDRNRGGSYLAIFVVGIGMFGIFLFLTYYLQATLHYSAVLTGISFLPMTAGIMVASIFGSSFLATRIGPRWIIGPGMLIAAVGMALLTGIGLTSDFALHVLPGTVVMGIGIGLVFSSAMSLATAGVHTEDAGVASAMVNTSQQIGGSIGTALLNTLAASAVTSYLVSHAAEGKGAVATASLHGYTTAFWWAAGIFAAGAVLSGIILRPDVPVMDPDVEIVHV
jgi:EmrB/QacA subfamily drug resistance transporter